jgi:tRNA U34 5-methylaminomethyl-2-thiouridine-forming methyltransferase MnmC
LEYGKTLAEESLFQRICRSPWKSSISISPYFDLYKNHQKLEKVVFADARFDLIYFDAFAPGKQPELWSFEILEKLSKSLKRTGMFVTYSSAGHLKRNLLKLGFEVEKPGGANGKREMTRAIKL